MKCCECMNVSCRCDSCFYLEGRDGKWWCAGYDKPCEQVEYCGCYDEESGCE